MHLDANNLYGWEMSQKLPVDGFKWSKKLFEFNEDFMKIMMKIVIKDPSRHTTSRGSFLMVLFWSKRSGPC